MSQSVAYPSIDCQSNSVVDLVLLRGIHFQLSRELVHILQSLSRVETALFVLGHLLYEAVTFSS